MFKNYIKLAFRNFKRRKGHTLINIIGLAIAIASCIFIGIYVQHELSYDTFWNKSDRIVRVIQTNITPEQTTNYSKTPFPVGATLESEFPGQVESSVRLFDAFDEKHSLISMADTTSFLEENFLFADSALFNVFDIELKRGNPETALDNPLSLIMTEEKARLYFGDENPIGQQVSFEGAPGMIMEVTGIMESLPANAHFQADLICSLSSIGNLYSDYDYNQDWFSTSAWTYVLLEDGADPDELSRQLPDFVDKYYAGDIAPNETINLELQPVESIHLYSNRENELQVNGSVTYVYLFSTVALLLLVIACINFMNLATAKATERSREVGMRKALGAGRFQLFLQFMGESFLMSFIAIVIAVILVAAGLPFVSDIIDKPLVFNPLQNIPLLAGIFILFMVVGFLAGLYPALYLSSYEPGRILNGETGSGRGGSLLRKGLVTVQFALSVLLIIGTVIVFLQLDHMQEKELGFDKEQIVLLDISENLIAWDYPIFKERALKNSGILSVTGVEKIPGSDQQNQWKVAPAGNEEETNQTLWVLHDFFETYNVEMAAGRSFSEEYANDNEGKSLLINEKMAQRLGHDDPRDALGEPFYHTTRQGERRPLQVAGVVKDFNYTSLKKEIQPMNIVLAHNEQFRVGIISYAAVKIEGGRIQEGLAHLEEVWTDVNHIDPFTYSFQDQELEKVYAAEATTSTMMSIFTVLCIIVACLGLFGLASFTASKRTKEIGIRKTLGASVSGIVLLLSKQYLKLVLIANIIIWPVIYYLSGWWLQEFSYRIETGWNLLLIFLAVAVISLLICLITVSHQSIKAARVNPVESIRQE